MKTILRLFFRLLYHELAFTYDAVAAAVSFNRWKDWIVSVVPFIEGERVLEIGHGPGHLQRTLLSRGLCPVGIDESAQMGRLARRNLHRAFTPPSERRGTSSSPSIPSPSDDYTQISLARALAQQLPFPNGWFDTIVATFPSEYITDPETLTEVQRCLKTSGRLVVLPAALPRNRFLEWLFRVTKQAPGEALDIVKSRLREPFTRAGFQTEVRVLDEPSGTLLIVLAKKSEARVSARGKWHAQKNT